MRGSVRLVVNATDGTVAQRLDYDEFGRVTADSAPGFQPFSFAGGLYDHRSGLVLFGYRVYDPFTGRFLTRDPLWHDGGHSNLYLYVANDPVNSVDPDGLYLESAIDIGLIGIDVLSIATKIQKGCRDLKDDFISLGANSLGLLLPGITGLGLITKSTSWYKKVSNIEKHKNLKPLDKIISDIGMMKVSNRTYQKIQHSDMVIQGKNLIKDRFDLLKMFFQIDDLIDIEIAARKASKSIPTSSLWSTGPTPSFHYAIDKITKLSGSSMIGSQALRESDR